MKELIKLSEHLYEIFLKLYPFSYREEFGGEMKYVYSRSIKEAYSQQGEKGLIRFWFITLADGVKSLIGETLDGEKGGVKMSSQKTDILMQNKIFFWIILGTGLVLSIPLVAMQFTSEVDWKLFDFAIMGTLMLGASFAFVVAARLVPAKYRVIVGAALFAALFVTWIHLAVGIVDTWPLAGS